MSYVIQWQLLTEDERAVLTDNGVEMSPSGIRFLKEPTWEDFTFVFATIFNLKTRTPMPDDNHINFAIGDCLVAGERFFGEKKVDAWLHEFLEFRARRDFILMISGATLIFLQQIEEKIKLCCAYVRLKDVNLTLEDFLSSDPSRRRYTLGQLANALKRTNAFKSDFEERLAEFVRMRNEFTHNLWIEHWRQTNETNELPTKIQIDEIAAFIRKLIHEATYFDKVFQGFMYDLVSASGVTPDTKVSGHNLATSWINYIAEFRSTLKGSDKTA